MCNVYLFSLDKCRLFTAVLHTRCTRFCVRFPRRLEETQMFGTSIITTLGSWLIAHPIVWSLVLLLLAPIAHWLVITLWNLVLIPPQRHLSIWTLKARLSKAESNLQKFHRLRDDTCYLIYRCAYFLSWAIASVFMLCLAGFQLLIATAFVASIIRHSHSYQLQTYGAWFLISFVSYMVLLSSVRGLKLVRDAIIYSENGERQLKRKIEQLNAKLRAKSTKQDPNEQIEGITSN